MTGRVKIIRVTTEIKEGRKEPTTEVFYECWCDVQSLVSCSAIWFRTAVSKKM